MKWLTAKSQVKVYMPLQRSSRPVVQRWRHTDTEQFQRFKDPNQWGAPAGNLNLDSL